MLLALSCASTPSPKAKPDAEPEVLRTGIFAKCGIDCAFDFRELAVTRPRVIQTYCRNAEPQCVDFEGVITRAGKAKLAKLGETLAAAQLEGRYGCGVCLDGNDYSFTVRHDDGRVSKHTYEASSENPEAPVLDTAHAVLSKVHDAIMRCASNELIKVSEQCTPYEKLRPRPFSRP
jgi:hypothetical protein